MKKLILVLGFLVGGCGGVMQPGELSGRWNMEMTFQTVSGLFGSVAVDGDNGIWFADTVTPARYYSGDVSISRDGVVSFWFGRQGVALELRMDSIPVASGVELDSIDPAITATAMLSR